MGRGHALRLGFAIAAALALTQCAWLLGFEPDYSVAGDAGPVSDVERAPDPDAASDVFGAPYTLVTGEELPLGGIAVSGSGVYWTRAGVDGGVRSVGVDGGDPITVATADRRGQVAEIYAAGNTIHWREEQGDCARKTRCGFSGEGGFTTCGARAVRLRANDLRIYVLLDEAIGTAKFPVAVLSPSCDPVPQKRLYGDASFVAYSNIVPDRSGNRVFAIAGTDVDCLPIDDGPTIRVVSANILDLAADDTHLYWLTPSEVHRCRFASETACGACTDDVVLARSRSGTSPALVLADETLYWLVPDGIASIAASAPAGSTASTVVSGQPAPTVFTVDATGIYWGDAKGTIARAPRR